MTRRHPTVSPNMVDWGLSFLNTTALPLLVSFTSFVVLGVPVPVPPMSVRRIYVLHAFI